MTQGQCLWGITYVTAGCCAGCCAHAGWCCYCCSPAPPALVQVALRCASLNKYLCADAGTGTLVFKTTRGRWEIVAASNATRFGGAAVASSNDGFVHINERVCLRSKTGMCIQLAVRTPQH